MSENQNQKYTHRLVARIVLEATSPLAVGSGRKDMLTDSLVATDVNGLPCIPATAVAGVLRHLIGETEAEGVFGKSSSKKQEVRGSNIIFTDAMLVGADGKAIDGLHTDLDRNDDFLRHYFALPIRQHVRMSDKGTAQQGRKFDEQVVYKGSRFCFEVEMVATQDDAATFEGILQQLDSPDFRIGGGTRCGFGAVKVVSCQMRTFNLTEENDRKAYAKKSSSLAEEWPKEWKCLNDVKALNDHKARSATTRYELHLKPLDFFLFGSGFGDEEADMTPVKELVVTWENGQAKFSEELTLLPATSVKGALAHRVAYHYNKKNGFTVGSENAKAGNENEAVRALFGYAAESAENKAEQSQRGRVLISDVFLSPSSDKVKDKVIPHVAIDRFTGGTIDGALFSEKSTYGGNGTKVVLTVIVTPAAETNQDLSSSAKAIEALQEALEDICKGLLPLGGGVNRGNGAFRGSLTKNGEIIYEAKQNN